MGKISDSTSYFFSISDVPVWKSSHPSVSSAPSSQGPLCRLLPPLVALSLSCPVLALMDSLLVLQLTPHCLHGSGACSHLPYLDPVLSMLAVGILIATALPQVSLCVYVIALSSNDDEAPVQTKLGSSTH